MAKKQIRLIDGGQDSSSRRTRIFAKLLQGYLGFVDSLVSQYARNQPDECCVNHYPELRKLEQNWSTVREELDSLISNISEVTQYEEVDKRYARQVGHSTKTHTKDEWRIEQFYLYGKRIERGCARAPKTAELLRSIPRVQTALFSILEPDAHIRAHRGEYSGALRCHLGVKIPSSSACKLRVEERIYHWEEGRIFIFDHKDEHEAWNQSGQRRGILIVDFSRRLPFPLSLLNMAGLKLLQLSPHMRQAMAILEKGPSQSSTVTPQ